MIKPLDINSSMTKPAALNLAFCAVPTVYESAPAQPVGQKLDLNCDGCKKPNGVGDKLDLVI